jgi:hypothetical protein
MSERGPMASGERRTRKTMSKRLGFDMDLDMGLL